MTPHAVPLPFAVFADGELTLAAPHLVAARFGQPKEMLSDAAWNGGWSRTARAVANHQMRPDAFASQAGQREYCRSLLERHDLPADTALQLTAAAVAAGGGCQWREEGLRVSVFVSAGVNDNALWAGDAASYAERGAGEFAALPAGTINTAVFVDGRLAEAALPHVFTVVAEAKCDWLQAHGVRSVRSGRAATGTGTDSTVVVADPRGARTFTTASTHSRLGMVIALTMRAALAAAVGRGERTGAGG